MKYLKDPKALNEASNNIRDVYLNIQYYMIPNMISNKNVEPVVIELLTRDRKLNISFAFVTQLYFTVPKNLILDSIHYFIMNIANKRELKQIAFNQSYDTEFD